MFDFTSSKLLILGIIALIVVGPKDLPILLRTVGKYLGMIRRQAADFRAQFDEAIRESELDQIKKDVEKIGQETEQSLRDTGADVQRQFDDAEQDMRHVLEKSESAPVTESAAEAPIGEDAVAAPVSLGSDMSVVSAAAEASIAAPVAAPVPIAMPAPVAVPAKSGA